MWWNFFLWTEFQYTVKSQTCHWAAHCDCGGKAKSKFGNKWLIIQVQTDLWPVANSPVGRTGDVHVAGGQRGGLGHLFALAGRQGFLLLCTHRLDAENGPLSLAWAPAARWAFLPLANPPPNTNEGTGQSIEWWLSKTTIITAEQTLHTAILFNCTAKIERINF